MVPRTQPVGNNTHVKPPKDLQSQHPCRRVATKSTLKCRYTTNKAMKKIFERSDWPIAGSTSYYSLLHCSDHAVGNARAILELIATISEALADVSEPTVAEQKVHWWHEELARLAKAEARHPSCQTFQSQMVSAFGQAPAIQSWIPDMLTVLSCNANERFSNADTDSSFRQRIVDDYGARLRLLARALQAPQAMDSDEAVLPQDLITEDLVLGLGLFDRLQRFHKLQAGGAMVWPDSWYTEQDLQPENLYDAEKHEQLMNLFATVVAAASEAIESGLSSVWQQPQHQTPLTDLPTPCAVIITAATLRLSQLAMWKRQQPDLLRQYQSLTPFRKSLVTWRTQRKLTQLQKRLQRPI